MWWFLLDLYINKHQFTKVSRPEPCLWILYSLFPKSAQHTVLKFGMGKEAALNSGLCFFIQVWLIYNGVPISAARQSDSVLHIYEWVSEVAQLSPTLCDPVDCSLPGFSVHGILQAWILEWVTISFSRGSSWPRDRTQVSCIGGRFFTRSHQEKKSSRWSFFYNHSIRHMWLLASTSFVESVKGWWGTDQLEDGYLSYWASQVALDV